MLREIIDKFYLDKQKYKEQTSFYVSEAGKCPRQIFFKFKNVPRKEMEAHILRLFDRGDQIHQLIMAPLLSTRDIQVVASEIDIPPQELFRGRIDAIVSDKKELYVLDIKSMNSMIFKTLTEPKQENIAQIQLYLHYLEIPKGILLYVNKDSQELKEFLVNYDLNIVKPILNKFTDLKKKLDSNTVPSRIAAYPIDWQCKYCQFREVCDMGEEGDMNWEDFKKRIESGN